MPRRTKSVSLQVAAGDPHNIGKNKLLGKLESEVQAERGLPSCPGHLTGVARSAWTFLSQELAGMGLDYRPDAMTLEGCCVAYARATAADALVAAEGLRLGVKAHPAIAISNTAWRQYRAFCSEFGLSPAARTGLAVERRADPIADLDALLMQPRVSKFHPH